MKNIVRKILVACLLVVASLTSVSAISKDIKTLNASYSNNKISYSGTTDSGVLAVTCELYNSNNQKVDIKSSEVDNNKFNDSFDAEAGTYTIKCANYDGGNVVSKEVDDKKEITSMNIKLENPIPGDKVNIINVDEGGFGYQDQDKLAEASTTDEGYEIEAAHYVKGKCTGEDDACEEYFEGTFEEGKDYYVMIYVNNKEGFKLTNTSIDNLKINGEDPEEVFPVFTDVFGGTRTMFVAKIKATKEAKETSTTSPSKTGDNIIMFIVLGVVSLLGLISSITFKRRKSN